MARVTITARFPFVATTHGLIPLGTALGAFGSIYLFRFTIGTQGGGNTGRVRIDLNDENDGAGALSTPFTDEMETEGSVTVIAPNGESVVFFMDGIDLSEPYAFRPSNWQELFSFAQGRSGEGYTYIFDDRQNIAPEPAILAQPNVINALGTVTLSGVAIDPDTVPDTLALALTATPDIGTLSAITQTGTDWSATWTAPLATDVDQSILFTIVATEPDEGLTGQATVAVVLRAGEYPTVTASGDQMTVDVGDVVNLMATAFDPQGLSLTYTWMSDLGGVLSAPTALVSTWTAPAVTESTVATLTFTASNGQRSRSTSVTVIVRAPATQPLMLPAVADQSYATGDIVNLPLPAAIEGLAPYIYSAAGLPRGLTFRNRAVIGRPDLPGTYTVTYTVTDSNQDMESQEFDIEITGLPIPQPVGLNMRIDWGNQFFANPHSSVYGRITGGIQCFRGKNTASAVEGRSQVGTMSFELLNDDGLYDDENPDSELAGLIYPGIQVQLRIGVAVIWTGVLDSHPSIITRSGNNTVMVKAHGVLSRTREAPVSGGSLTAESTAQAFIEMCIKGDAPYESPQPEPGDAYIMNRWWEVGFLLQTLHVLEDTEGGFIFEDREGELGFHLAPYRGERTVNKTFVIGTPGPDEIQIDGEPRKLTAVKDVRNVVLGDVRQFQTKAGETLYESEVPIPIALGGRQNLVSVYPVSNGAVTELEDIVAGTDWTANTVADGSGTNRTDRVDVDAELMDFNEIHITIAYPTGAGFDSLLYVRGLTIEGTVLTVSTPLQVTRDDTVSKERYRPTTRRLDNTWIRSVADMENRADAILEVLSTPERRYRLSYLVEDWETFLSLDLSDRVALELANLEADAFIESIKLDIRPGGAYYSTLDLSVTDTERPASAPAFADDTGDAQDWTAGDDIVPITVPKATGTPMPTYSVVGSLPAGIAFDTDTRVLSGSPTTAGSGTIRIRATNSEGSDDWTLDYATAAAATPLLVLAALETTGRSFDAMVLLEASADATPIPSNLYADADQGGTDTPIEGEFGLGTGQTVISRVRRQESDGLATLTFNDNDNPEALSIGDYFATGGDGDDLNLTIQTAGGGAADLPPSAFRRGGSSFAHWTLTAAAETVVDAIEDGDRFIIAFWRVTP